jgi:hypothetical protein
MRLLIAGLLVRVQSGEQKSRPARCDHRIFAPNPHFPHLWLGGRGGSGPVCRSLQDCGRLLDGGRFVGVPEPDQVDGDGPPALGEQGQAGRPVGDGVGTGAAAVDEDEDDRVSRPFLDLVRLKVARRDQLAGDRRCRCVSLPLEPRDEERCRTLAVQRPGCGCLQAGSRRRPAPGARSAA